MSPPWRFVMQRKTQRPLQFEITEQVRDAVGAWITAAHLKPEQFLFPSRVSESPISRLGNTHGSSVPGCGRLGLIRRPAAPIRCGALNRRLSIVGPTIFGRLSYCSVTANSKAQSDTSASSSMMRWRLQCRLRCNPVVPVAAAGYDGRRTREAVHQERKPPSWSPARPSILMRTICAFSGFSNIGSSASDLVQRFIGA